MINKIIHIFKDSSGSFEGQETGERVSLLLRRHPVVAYMRIGVFFLGLLAPIFVGLIFFSAIFKTDLWPLFFFVSSLWCLAFWFLMFYSLTIYTLNVVIITDRRIIDSDQHGLFNRKVSELHISRVQDVSVHIHGILETFLKFGDLVVQTAGQEMQFVFHEIPHPDKARGVIMQIVADSHARGRHL